MEGIPSQEQGTPRPEEKAEKEAQREVEAAASERQFFGAMLSKAKDVKEKTADRLFADARGYIDAIAGGDQAEGLKPFLEHVAKSADAKTQEAAKQALARLELGKT